MAQQTDLPPLSTSLRDVLASMLAPWRVIGIVIAEVWPILLLAYPLVALWMGWIDGLPLMAAAETTGEMMTWPLAVLFEMPMYLDIAFLGLVGYLTLKMLTVGPRI